MLKVTCQYCKTKDNRDEMVCEEKQNIKKYYHNNCLIMKKNRDEAVNIFYEYTKCLEPVKKVYDAFKKIKTKGINEEQILYLVKYVRDNRCVLNYPHGLLYYLDSAMKDYRKNKQTATIINTTKQNEDFVKIEIKKDFTNKEDELDISDFI